MNIPKQVLEKMREGIVEENKLLELMKESIKEQLKALEVIL
jgi:hypothetical protein